jgi:hypothetical protein
MKTDKDVKHSEILLNEPVVKEQNGDILQVECTDAKENLFRIIFYEDRFEVSCNPKEKGIQWWLELKTAPDMELPFQSFEADKIKAEFRGYRYTVVCTDGTVEKGSSSGDYVFRLIPSKNKLAIDCTNTIGN